eukprot:SM000036S13241  [mRNA]  locus=s36:107611:111620:+ [translate_table: standard]
MDDTAAASAGGGGGGGGGYGSGEARPRPLVVVLGGAPGSGKSTFCESLRCAAPAGRPWVRICQDVAGAGGKRGTRKQCLRKAEAALRLGQSVLIDRCNMTVEQRLDFLALARASGAEAHAVFLDLPAQLCIERVAARQYHEGGLQGAGAARVVRQQLGSKVLPGLAEGFSRVSVCHTELSVSHALGLYAKLDAEDCLPGGVHTLKPLVLEQPSRRPLTSFGFSSGGLGVQEKPISKTKPQALRKLASHCPVRVAAIQNVPEEAQTGAQKSLVPPNAPDRRGLLGAAEKGDEPNQGEEGGSSQAPCMDVDATGRTPVADAGHALRLVPVGDALDAPGLPRGNKLQQEHHATRAKISSVAPVLAFPSLSTGLFQFNIQKAGNILVHAVRAFLNDPRCEDLRLALVDPEADGPLLRLVRELALGLQLDAERFQIISGELTELASSGTLIGCAFLANAANWRLKPGGGGVNAAIHEAAGPCLLAATKQRAATLRVGEALTVPLPPSSPLRSREGVTHIIHVLGPNMNPRLPDCLQGDYAQGCQLLQAAYESLFERFSSAARAQQGGGNGGETGQQALSTESSDDITASCRVPHTEAATTDAFAFLMQSAKRKDQGAVCSSPAKMKGMRPGAVAGRVGAEINEDSNNSARSQRLRPGSPWTDALRLKVLNPDEQSKDTLLVDDQAVVIRDLYPKAKRHLLVLTREAGLHSLGDVQQRHLPLLKHMHDLGKQQAAELVAQGSGLAFRLGYHVYPSMRQLHLHIISQDFESPHLTTKRHWNSFTTPFFANSRAVIDQVAARGFVSRPSSEEAESLLKRPLECHRCRAPQANLPKLKAHIRGCRAPLPMDYDIQP